MQYSSQMWTGFSLTLGAMCALAKPADAHSSAKGVSSISVISHFIYFQDPARRLWSDYRPHPLPTSLPYSQFISTFPRSRAFSPELNSATTIIERGSRRQVPEGREAPAPLFGGAFAQLLQVFREATDPSLSGMVPLFPPGVGSRTWSIPASLPRLGRRAPPPPRYPYWDARAAWPVLSSSRWPAALPCSGPRPTPLPAAWPAHRRPAAAPGPAGPTSPPNPFPGPPTGLPWEDGAVVKDAAAALLLVASDAKKKLKDKDEDETGPLPSLHGTPAQARC